MPDAPPPPKTPQELIKEHLESARYQLFRAYAITDKFILSKQIMDIILQIDDALLMYRGSTKTVPIEEVPTHTRQDTITTKEPQYQPLHCNQCDCKEQPKYIGNHTWECPQCKGTVTLHPIPKPNTI